MVVVFGRADYTFQFVVPSLGFIFASRKNGVWSIRESRSFLSVVLKMSRVTSLKLKYFDNEYSQNFDATIWTLLLFNVGERVYVLWYHMWISPETF